MKTVVVLGAGQIGTAVAEMLSGANYFVDLADQKFSEKAKQLLNRTTVTGHEAPSLHTEMGVKQVFEKAKKPRAVISCLPHECNKAIAKVAVDMGMHYFDLTEDVETSEYIQSISKGADSAFVPQCGLAPGFISIAANDIMKRFDAVSKVKLRVGSLPAHPNNKLKYNLMWSTNGLINECGNTCHGIKEGELVDLEPMENLETISINGVEYEAFNTSGGIGTLLDTWKGKVKYLTYKTLRYPGHCDLFKFLLDDLSLNSQRDTLEAILEHAIPRTKDDLVIIYISVTGTVGDETYERNYVRKIYPLNGYPNEGMTAIQLTT
ncbi:hypothetical protein LCGC14_1620270, partial [marine sediment metagenome]